jgi:ribosome-binding factor A
MSTRRQRRVAELIHRELGWLLLNETRDPRVVNVTITGVDVTPDLMLARIYFSVLGDADEENEALSGLRKAGGFLRTRLAGRVHLRFMPELVFELDKSASYGRRIDELLDQIAESDHPVDEA